MLLRMLRLATVMAAIGYASAATVADSKRVVIPGIGEYFYVGLPMNWTEAFLTCEAGDTHLAVIDSAAEAAALKQMMTDNGDTFIHLGFHDKFIEGKYNSILDKPMNSDCTAGNEWAVGSPKGGETYNCGGFSEAGITDTRCEDKEVFFCETPTTAPVRDFTHVAGFGYYKYIRQSYTWPKAAQACRDLGAHLIVINSQAEIRAVLTEFNVTSGWIFVGIHRVFGGDANFFSVLGQRLSDTGFSTWAPGNPFGTYIKYPYAKGWGTPGMNSLETVGGDESPSFIICELEM